MVEVLEKLDNGLIKADSLPLLNIVFGLRYKAYHAMGAIPTLSSQQFTDKYDEQDHCRSYLYYNEGKLVGSIRACVYPGKISSSKIPAFDYFQEEINSALGDSVTLVESSRFVIDPIYQASSIRHLFNIFRAIFLNAMLYKADYVVTIVNPEHSGFYKKIFDFREISLPKAMNDLKVPPGVLLAAKSESVLAITEKKSFTRISPQHIKDYLETGMLLNNA